MSKERWSYSWWSEGEDMSKIPEELKVIIQVNPDKLDKDQLLDRLAYLKGLKVKYEFDDSYESQKAIYACDACISLTTIRLLDYDRPTTSMKGLKQALKEIGTAMFE